MRINEVKDFIKRLKHFVVLLFASIEVVGTTFHDGSIQFSEPRPLPFAKILSDSFRHGAISGFGIDETFDIVTPTPSARKSAADFASPRFHERKKFPFPGGNTIVAFSDYREPVGNQGRYKATDDPSPNKPKQINPLVQFIHFTCSSVPRYAMGR